MLIVIGAIKNLLLFGNITDAEAINKFDAIKTEISNSNIYYEHLLQLFINIIENPEKKTEIERIQAENVFLLSQTQELLAEYKKSFDGHLIHNLMEIYVNQLMPNLKKLRRKFGALNHFL